MAFGKFLGIILFVLLISGFVFAELPGMPPNRFYGYVTVNGAAADGATIDAKINNLIVASTTSVNGNYGIEPNVFDVPDPNGTNNGKTIEFFLNGTKVADATFKTGAPTKLDLSYGEAPYCGDGACNSGEDCSSCEADCGTCGGGTLPGSNTGNRTGAGGSPRLGMEIAGNCVGQDIEVTVLNSFGNPTKGAEVRVVKDNKTVEKQVTEEGGKLLFSFEEEGEYSFYANKRNYLQNMKKVDLAECDEGEEGPGITEPVGPVSGQGESLCANVDCDDGNPCTAEFCINATGHCAYEPRDGIACGVSGTCVKGSCEEAKPVGEGPVVPTAFFGLAAGQAAGFGIAVVALIAGLAYLFALGKRKKKE